MAQSESARTFLFGFAGAALACVIGLGCFGVWQLADESSQTESSSESQNTSEVVELGSSEQTTIVIDGENITLAETVAEKVLPSVVAIDVYVVDSQLPGMSNMNQDTNTESLTQSSLGSGVVLTEDGYILTNYHVIEGADALTVTIEGTQYDAEIVGSDPSSDIAVVKAVDTSGLTPIELGDSDDLSIGEWVMTVGSPFGLEQSVATGIVSATSRSQIYDSSMTDGSGEITIYANMIQTDAAINPGNSGGALVDSDGKLIGINTLITSYSGNYSGVGFAIPANYAISLAEQIIAGDTPTHAELGVSLSTVTSDAAQRYGLAVDSGAYISDVESGSGAAAAGLQAGDIITAFDGVAVESASDLMIDVRTKNPGDVVTLEVNRSGEVLEIQVTLGSDGEEDSSSLSENISDAESSFLEWLRGE